MNYRRFGRTGLTVSEVIFGGAGSLPHLVIAGLDPAIQAALAPATVLDHRVEPGDDKEGKPDELKSTDRFRARP